MSYIPNRGDFESPVSSMFLHAYDRNRAFSSTLRRLQSETGLLVEGTVLRALEKQGFSFDVSKDNKSVYSPDKLWAPLAKYATASEMNYDKQCYKEAWDLTFKAFGNKGSFLQPLLSEDDFRSSVKFNKASGAPHFGKKADWFESDYQRSLRVADGKCAPQPCVAYHRVQHGEEGPKVRLVWGYPASMTLVEARFARPLIDHFLRDYSVMAFGLHKYHVASRLVPMENSGVRYGLDFSGFDSSINAQLIHQAFKVLRTYFDETDDNANYWSKIISYFIHTTIIMPDGNVYQKHGGVPSGSYFTQLIDSVVNYFAIQYMALRLKGVRLLERKVLVLGDDSIFGWNEYVHLSEIQKVMSELGLKINVDKSLVTREGENVEFLGHEWDKGLIDRPEKEVAIRMAFPETYHKFDSPEVRWATRVLSYSADSKTGWRLLTALMRQRMQSHGNLKRFMRHKIDGVQTSGWDKFSRELRGESEIVRG